MSSQDGEGLDTNTHELSDPGDTCKHVSVRPLSMEGVEAIETGRGVCPFKAFKFDFSKTHCQQHE